MPPYTPLAAFRRARKTTHEDVLQGASDDVRGLRYGGKCSTYGDGATILAGVKLKVGRFSPAPQKGRLAFFSFPLSACKKFKLTRSRHLRRAFDYSAGFRAARIAIPKESSMCAG